MARTPVLFVFSGLPGAGKSTLARALVRKRCAAYLRIDTIEQALKDLCSFDVHGEGYGLAYRIASDNLCSGVDVVADSCNPIQLTRQEWANVATLANAQHVDVEIVCSDAREHRRRVEGRASEVPGLTLPTWAEVVAREYHEWTTDRLIVDTAGSSILESETYLLGRIDRILAGKGYD
jgi:predicted kinase